MKDACPLPSLKEDLYTVSSEKSSFFSFCRLRCTPLVYFRTINWIRDNFCNWEGLFYGVMIPSIFSINRILVMQSLVMQSVTGKVNWHAWIVMGGSYFRMWFLKFRVGIFPTHNKFFKCIHSAYLLVTPVTSDCWVTDVTSDFWVTSFRRRPSKQYPKYRLLRRVRLVVFITYLVSSNFYWAVLKSSM